MRIFDFNCFHARTVESGAQTTIYCAVEEKIAEHNGRSVFDAAFHVIPYDPHCAHDPGTTLTARRSL